MSNIPLKGGDGNDDIETADKTKDNPAKMSECWKNLSTSWKVGIPLIITGAILIVVGVIVGSTVGESKQDCSQDSFAGVNVGSEYLKYKIIPDSFNLLSWAGAQKKCEDEGATMWEVMNEVEWNKIYRILEDKNRNIIWINGKSTAECNDPQKCKREAGDGNGLPVSWPSNPDEPAEYSKFIGGEKDGCMSVNADDLWVKINCDDNKQTAVCVKRKCKRPDKED